MGQASMPLTQAVKQGCAITIKGSGVRSNNNLASGLKFRPRSCPYALVVRRSGV